MALPISRQWRKPVISMGVVSVSPASGPPGSDPDALLTWSSWYHGIRPAATRSLRTRYTTARASRYFHYAERTSIWRHVAVVFGAPGIGLLASLIAPCLPVQPPSTGLAKNTGFWLHGFVTITFTMMGAMLQTRAATSIKHDEYSNLDITAAAIIGSVHVVGVIMLLGYCWRFPVPFTWVVAVVPWIFFLIWSNILVLRFRLVQPHTLGKRLLFYVPSLVVQVCQLVLYPAYSAAFEAAGLGGQYALIIFFPLVKLILKRCVYAVSHHLTEFAKEVSVSGVEICASMYQSMIMQNTPSLSATALVIGLDICQGLFELKLFVDHESSVLNADILSRAMEVLENKHQATEDTSLNRFASNAWRFNRPKKPSTALILPAQEPKRATRKSRSRSGSSTAGETNDLVLTQALELLQAADTMLLLEYLEVAIPVVNAVYLCVASQLKSAIYNPKLHAFYLHPVALQAAVYSVLLYATLQAFTLVGICFVMHVRYRLSALTLLAFVLEDHAWSIQGKMLAWLPSLFAFSILHYGTDFTFKFDFAVDPGS